MQSLYWYSVNQDNACHCFKHVLCNLKYIGCLFQSKANIKELSAAGWIVILVSMAGDKSVPTVWSFRLGHQSASKVQRRLSAHTAEQAFFPKKPKKQISETEIC